MNQIIIDKYILRYLDMGPLEERLSKKGRTRERVLHPKAHEHYRLLYSISQQYSGAKFLDLGTFIGASALCLGVNRRNTVLSYDVENCRNGIEAINWKGLDNITFKLADVKEFEPSFYDDFDFIMLDLDHVVSEPIVWPKIEASKFKGLLLIDDITYKHFRAMRQLWARIENPRKLSLNIHRSGTGLVPFSDVEIIIQEGSEDLIKL